MQGEATKIHKDVCHRATEGKLTGPIQQNGQVFQPLKMANGVKEYYY